MTRFNPKVGDLVYLQWDDHCSYATTGWKPMNDIGFTLSASICETVGFVIHITPDTITTCASVAFNDEGDDANQIATRLRRDLRHGKIIKRFKRPRMYDE